ncbi:MAG: FHA domain-containing protein [Polyangia bacterium]
MSILDDLLRTLRAPLDFVRGKTSSVRSVEGRAQGGVMRIKNLPQEFKGELDYNKQLVKDYGRRAKRAKDYAAGKRDQGASGPTPQAQGGKKKMGLFSKKRRCPGCNEKLDARWELCPYCGHGASEDGGEPQRQDGGPPRTQALDLGQPQGGYNQGNQGYGNQPQGGKPRTMALDIGSVQSQAPQRGESRLVAWLIALEGPQGGQLLELRARSIVGTAPDCDVVVKDGSISGRHAEFSAQGGVYRVSDLGSTNGTFVNEKRVQNAELVDGDTLRLGRTPFKFKST